MNNRIFLLLGFIFLISLALAESIPNEIHLNMQIVDDSDDDSKLLNSQNFNCKRVTKPNWLTNKLNLSTLALDVEP